MMNLTLILCFLVIKMESVPRKEKLIQVARQLCPEEYLRNEKQGMETN
jgi:hypothetical protein